MMDKPIYFSKIEFKNENVEFRVLSKTYRTTKEIMNLIIRAMKNVFSIIISFIAWLGIMRIY